MLLTVMVWVLDGFDGIFLISLLLAGRYPKDLWSRTKFIAMNN